MALNFLNALAQFAPSAGYAMPGVIGGFGGGTFNMDGTQATPTQPGYGIAAPEVARQAPQQQPRKGGFMNTLGQIGDVLAVMGNRAPVYSTMNQQRAAQEREAQKQQILAGIDPNNPESVNALLPLDPELWSKLRDGLMGEAYTLSEGQRRYQGNRVIAEGPQKRDIRVIDDVAVDFGGAQPVEVWESPYPDIISGPEGSFYEQPRRGIGARSTPGGVSEGATATNPQTGEKIVFRNGQWAAAMSDQQGGQALSAAHRSQTISAAEAARIRQSLGPNGQAAFQKWMRDNNIVISGAR